MQYIRAAEHVRLAAMRSCVSRYPHLASFVVPDDPEARTRPGMLRLREHAVELGRQGLLEELRQFQDAQGGMEASHAKSVRDHLHTRLRRLRPGSAQGVRAVQLTSDEITTQASRIAAELTAHWSKVFSDRPVDPGSRS